jgi:Ca2+/Na+ antiporter
MKQSTPETITELQQSIEALAKAQVSYITAAIVCLVVVAAGLAFLIYSFIN